MLEYNLIQQHRPRFNIRYRDDKSYPYLALTVGETWPRAQVLRGTKRKGVRYFGPYGHAWAIRDTLDALTRVFPVRTCSNAFFDQRARARRPCLYYDIGRCAGPCVPEVTGITEESLPGARRRHGGVPGRQRAGRCSAARDARCGPRPSARSSSRRRSCATSCSRPAGPSRSQEMVLSPPQDLDVDRPGRRRPRGRVPGLLRPARPGAGAPRLGRRPRRGPRSPRPGRVVPRAALHGARQEVPPRVLVPDRAGRRRPSGGVARPIGAAGPCGSPCRTEARSGKLLEVVARNATEAFHRHKLRRASDFGARSRALAELADQLGLEQAPLRIECYDISNLGPTDKVGSMVVFEDGLPKRQDYRKFKIKGVAGSGRLRLDGRDAPPAVHAAAWRSRNARPEDGRAPRFSYPPALVVVDGGRGQLAQASGSSRSSACRSRTSALRSGSRRSTSRTSPTRS